MSSRIRILTIITLLSCAPSLMADTVFLRGGRIMTGKIIGQNRTSLRIRSRGKIRSISKRRIRRIQYGSAANDALIRKRTERRLAARKAREKEREALRRESERKEQERKEKLALAKKRPIKQTQSFDWSGRLGAAWRSAVLPGWGLYHSDDKLFAYIHGGLFVASLGYALSANASASVAQSDYDAALTRNLLIAGPVIGASESLTNPPTFLVSLLLNNGAFSGYEARTSRANQAMGVVGLVYLAQIAHAFWVGGKPKKAGRMARNEKEGTWRIVVIPPHGKRASRGGTRIVFETKF